MGNLKLNKTNNDNKCEQDFLLKSIEVGLNQRLIGYPYNHRYHTLAFHFQLDQHLFDYEFKIRTEKSMGDFAKQLILIGNDLLRINNEKLREKAKSQQVQRS